MKKIFFALDISLILGIIASVICNAIFAQAWIEVLLLVLTIVTAVFNLLYVFNFKSKGAWISAILITLSVFLALVANSFIVKNPTAFFILLSLAEIALVVSLIFNTKFSINDIFYVLAISIPVVIFINIAPIFGFANVGNRIVVSLLMLTVSALFGLSIAHVSKKQNVFNITFSVFSFLNLVYGFGLVVLKQCNVTHKIEPIINVVFYILLLCYLISLIFITDLKHSEQETKTKRSIFNSVNLLLVTSIICYTIASNFMAFNFVSGKIFKNELMSKVNNTLEIPIVEIYTQNNQQPYSKEDYVNCSFKISNCENEEDNFSVPMTKNYEDEGCVGIRLRGNSTMKARKRPYRIKFDEKQSLFGLKANKSWVLLADYYDQSYIRNYTAFTLASEFENLDFTPTPHHVALVINNEFKGLYLLCEQMDEKKGRANVDDDFDVASDTEFPFFVEMDLNAYMEGTTGVDNFYVDAVNNHVEIKFPEADERGATEESDKVYDYIYEYINAVFTTIKTNEKVEVSFRETPVGLEDLVNIDSMVDYYLIHEIMLNPDNMFKSTYLHKTKDGKMEFGPIWDFDFSLATEWNVPYEKSYIEDANKIWVAKKGVYQNLLNNEEFYNKVATRFDEKKNAILETVNTMKEYKQVIDEVATIDSKMWHGTTGEFQFDMQYDYVRLFLMDRYSYLDTVFDKTHADFLTLIK